MLSIIQKNCPVSTGHFAILLNVRVVPTVTSVLQTVHRTLPDITPAHFRALFSGTGTTALRTSRYDRAPLYCVRGVPGKDGESLNCGLRNCRRLSKLGEFADCLRVCWHEQGGWVGVLLGGVSQTDSQLVSPSEQLSDSRSASQPACKSVSHSVGQSDSRSASQSVIQ